jgi:hypothetical protein
MSDTNASCTQAEPRLWYVKDCPYDDNSYAAAIAIILIATLCIAWYILDIIVTATTIYRIKDPGTSKLPIVAVGTALNSLSAFIAVGIGIVYYYTKWPQPLMTAGFLIVLLGQVSALGWTKYFVTREGSDGKTPTRSDMLTEAILDKLPEFAAVAATAFGVWAPQRDYQNETCNQFYTSHSPLLYAISGSVIGLLGLMLGVAVICECRVWETRHYRS